MEGTWSGFGIDGLNAIFEDGWDGCGIVEIAGMRRVGKSVSPSRQAGTSFSSVDDLRLAMLTFAVASSLACESAATGG